MATQKVTRGRKHWESQRGFRPANARDFKNQKLFLPQLAVDLDPQASLHQHLH